MGERDAAIQDWMMESTSCSGARERPADRLARYYLQVGAFEPRSLVNGPGVRAVVWVQGCGRRCPGCFNPEFLPFEGGRAVPVAEVIQWIADSAAAGNRAPDARSGLPAPPRQAGDRAYTVADADDVGRVPSRGEVEGMAPDAGSGDRAYRAAGAGDVGRVPSRGVGVGRVPSRGEVEGKAPDARSGDRAYRAAGAGYSKTPRSCALQNPRIHQVTPTTSTDFPWLS